VPVDFACLNIPNSFHLTSEYHSESVTYFDSYI